MSGVTRTLEELRACRGPSLFVLAATSAVLLIQCAPLREAGWGIRTAFHTRRSFQRPESLAPEHAIGRPAARLPYVTTALAPAEVPPSTTWSLTPGARGVAGHVPAPVPRLDFEWDFELQTNQATGDLSGWTVRESDEAFAVSCGRLDPSRLPHGDALRSTIGGDYWTHSYWPGQSGECLLDTEEHHITLASSEFILGVANQHISFLVGGGQEGGSVWLEVAGASSPLFIDKGPGSLGMVRRDHIVPAAFFGRKARVVVQGWGHGGILLDDVVGSAVALDWRQPDGPVWGFADLHNHLFNHLTFGGRVIAGRVTEHPLSWDRKLGFYDEDGMQHALQDCGPNHGYFFADNALSLSPEFLHDRKGFPTFDGWPKASTTSHEQVYVDWLKRAWQGGLRLMQLDVGNSAFSAEVFDEANFFLGGNREPSPPDDIDAVEHTLDAVDEFVAGEGQGWAEIARTPSDARRIVGQGKLALVLGVEVDAMGDFFSHCPRDSGIGALRPRHCVQLSESDPNARKTISTVLEHLRSRGVVHVIPVHVIENAFGYPAVYGRAFDINSQWANGAPGFGLENGWSHGVRFRLDDDTVDGSSVLTWVMSVLGCAVPDFDPKRFSGGSPRDQGVSHISARGLKRPGRILLDEMMHMGMLIDVQHMGEHATDETLDIAASHGYPVMSSHTSFREISFGYTAKVGWDPKRSEATVKAYDTASVERISNDALKSPAQIERIRQLGGVVGVGLGSASVAARWGQSGADYCDDTSTTWKHSYEYAIDHMGGRGIALGSDANGLATFPKPRFGTDACLGAHGDDYRVKLLGELADRQRNGVRYDTRFGRMGLADAGTKRFDDYGDGYAYSGPEREVWEGLADAEVAASQPTVADAYRFIIDYDQRAPMRDPATAERVRNYAKGFWAKQHGYSRMVLDGCDDKCDGNDSCPNVCAGYDREEECAYKAFPEAPERPGVAGGCKPFVKRVVDAWMNMQGNNAPIHKYVSVGVDDSGRTINRDFDVNVEGMAHYGLLPDWLQDVKNVGVDEQRMAPLFMGAEDYVEMWERASARAKTLGPPESD